MSLSSRRLLAASRPLRGPARLLATKPPANKLDKAVAVPVDKARISPIRSAFYGDLASFNSNCLPFPNALTPDAKDTLTALVDPVEKFFAKVPSARIDEEHAIPAEVTAGLRELGLYGLQIPEEYGGLGLSNTGYARIVEEIVMDASIAVTLMAHQSIGLKGILMFGTDAQKQKYLPALASGEHVAAFALTEPQTGSDAASVQLKATPTPDGQGFLLTGQKMWISNGGTAAVYTVFARTPTEDGKDTKLTAFIVEKAFGNITPGPPEKKLGIRGSNTCVVTFDGCFVPRENVLGVVNGGLKVALSILSAGRYGMGAATGGGIRKLIALAADYANNRVQFGSPIASYGLIQEKFARMAIDAYTVESMAYLTTGLIDTKGTGSALPLADQMDMSIEAAACKIYGSEAMFSAVNDCIQILGGMGFSAGGAYPFERMLRDSRILLIFEGTNEILRLFIALTCIQGPGASLKELSNRLKANPASVLAELPALMTAALRQFAGLSVGLPQIIPGGVAPALAKEAEGLSSGVARLEVAVRSLLLKHGKNVVHEQLQLQRVANIAIDVYATMAVLARASASIKEGSGGSVTHPEHELQLAKAAAARAQARIRANFVGVTAGAQANGDADTVGIAKTVLGAGRYLAAHPLRV